MRHVSILAIALIAAACANTNCREARHGAGAPEVKKELDPMAKTSAADRVKVFKFDGSLQCGQGKAIPAATMQSELEGIHVYSASTKNDGMMRIQVCGSPTGMANVFEIDRKNLEAALKRGFKEWTAD